jgi:hypothetical protein
MLHRLSRFRLALIVCLLLFTDSPFAGAAQRPAPEAQPPAAQAAPQVLVGTEQDARETRESFESVLKRLPPEVGRVMRIDPSLLRNDSYLAPYPILSAFLKQHPEIVQNPSYYLEHVNYEMWNPREPGDARREAVHMWNQLFQGIAVFVVFVTVVSAILWIIRTIVEYRRWYRTSKVQTEVHTKLMDRFTSNEDLMAYIQTPSGRRFLESTPLSLDAPPRTVGAPLSRILWSLQAGVVLAVASFGLLFTSNRVMEEVSQPLFAIGVLVLALGIGFVVSAAASFLLSRRLGLLDPAGAREHTGGTVA